MKLLIYSKQYPTSENPYANMFVHTRAKAYAQNHEVAVVAISEASHDNYSYDGVSRFFFQNTASLLSYVQETKPEAFCIHFYEAWMLNEVIKKINTKVFIWIHGYGAMHWKRRHFEIDSFMNYPAYIKENNKQLNALKKLIDFSNKEEKCHFVFVSKWICNITQADTKRRIKFYSIIPNPVDNQLFAYKKKTKEHRNSILLIRPFHTRKYATDIACKSILSLAKKDFFKELHIEIYGKGYYFEQDTKALTKYANVVLHNNLIDNKDIPSIQDNFGLFLCPTRLDTHGVSMCEAMSSGLLPIASDNSAIPEYLTHANSGFLTNNRPKSIVDVIAFLYDNPDIFMKMSEKAAQEIRDKCAIDIIIDKEIKLFHEK